MIPAPAVNDGAVVPARFLSAATAGHGVVGPVAERETRQGALDGAGARSLGEEGWRAHHTFKLIVF